MHFRRQTAAALSADRAARCGPCCRRQLRAPVKSFKNCTAMHKVDTYRAA